MTDPRRQRDLPVPLVQLVDQSAPPHVRQLWLDLNQRRARRRSQDRQPVRARTWIAIAACFALLSTSGFLLSGDSSARAGALTLTQGAALPAQIQTGQPYQPFDLSDGSRITLVRGARLDVLESSPRSVVLALRAGRVRFDVRPHGPRTWRIDCGAFSVEVVGTKFVLQRSTKGLKVDVLHGAVLVRGEGIPDGVQRLEAGQSLHARPPQPVAQVENTPVLQPTRGVPVLQSLGAQIIRSSVGHTPKKRALALRGRRRQHAASASAGAGANEAPRKVADGDDIEGLFREADKARLEGRLDDAVVALRRILERHADDSRAALAGFALGRLQLSALGQPELAARNLRLALALGLPAALSEDAHAKLAEAYQRAGDQAAACSAWHDYVRRYPQGAKRQTAPVRCEVDSAQ
jgi:transmembrane sensor